LLFSKSAIWSIWTLLDGWSTLFLHGEHKNHSMAVQIFTQRNYMMEIK